MLLYFNNIKLLHAENYWKSRDNVRKFFVEFASKKGFDPLVAENWRKVKGELSKTSAGALSHYQGRLHQALADVFPDLGLHIFFFPFLFLQFFFQGQL